MRAHDHEFGRKLDAQASSWARADRRDRLIRNLRVAAKVIAFPIVILFLGGALLASTFGGRK